MCIVFCLVLQLRQHIEDVHENGPKKNNKSMPEMREWMHEL